MLVTIRDTGTGMDAHTKEHLFEPFFTTKPVGQGTGLGLSTVYGIVKELGGSIQVDSEVGKGSAFRISVPAAEEISEIHHEKAQAKPGSTVVGRATILLVEDEDTVRRFAKLALERHGLPRDRSRRAGAGAVPGRRHRGTHCAAADRCRHASAQRAGAGRAPQEIRPDLPVLYMSGYPASMVMKGESLDASVRLLPKPFTTAELLASIEEVLGKT